LQADACAGFGHDEARALGAPQQESWVFVVEAGRPGVQRG